MSSPRFEVVKRSFSLRDGSPAEYDIILHPGAAVILPILDEDRIVMIRNRRIAVEEDVWEIPAGTLEEDEDPAACAKRELTEETGYSAQSLEKLVEFFSTPGICNERMILYVARGLSKGAPSLDDKEEIETHILKFDAALQMARDGEIRDGKSLLALLYFDRFVRQTGAR
ncbi:MAG: NUDIX hydrolase [Phycisphaerae bacterium]